MSTILYHLESRWLANPMYWFIMAPFRHLLKVCAIYFHYGVPRWWFQTCFIFTPKIGEMILFDEHIFQMGWKPPTSYSSIGGW